MNSLPEFHVLPPPTWGWLIKKFSLCYFNSKVSSLFQFNVSFNSMSLPIHVLSFNSSIKWFATVWVNFMISSQNFKLIWFTICDVACFPINKQWKLGWKEAIILPSYTHFPLLTPFEPSKLLSFQVTFVKDYTYTKGKKWNKMVEVKEKIKVKWSEQKKKKKTSRVMKK